MSILNNRPLLLSIIGVLVTVKFVVQPIFAWQDDVANKLTRQSQQLNKGLTLIENQEELRNQLDTLREKRVTLSEGLLGIDRDSTGYQLRVQRLIDELLEKNKLKARNSNWFTPVSDGVKEEQRVEIALSGKQKDFIKFLLDIENTKPKLAIVQIGSAINKMSSAQSKLGTFNGMIVVTGWRALPTSELGAPEDG